MSIVMIIFPVIFQILIMEHALTTEVKNTTVSVYDLSNSPSSRSLIESIKNNPLFNYRLESSSFKEIRKKIDNGEVKIGIVIPENFDRLLGQSSGADIQYIIDGQDANSSNVASGYLNAIITQWENDFFENEIKNRKVGINSTINVCVNPLILFNPLLKPKWYMVPALVVFLITTATCLLTALSIVREKEEGTLEQLMVSPIKSYHIIFGKTIPYFLIGFLELAVFLLFVILWLGIPFRGNVFVLILFGAAYIMAFLGIGILTSTIARTSQQVLFMTWFIMTFFIMLSGFFVPVENMPVWIQKITVINPVKYFMFAIRELCLKGTSLCDLSGQLFSLTIIGITVFSAAALLFHKKTT